MEKLTPIQLEQLIENCVTKANKEILSERQFIASFKTKWNSKKTKEERFKCLDELFLTRKKLINEGKSVKSIDENWMTDLFSRGLGGFKETFKEWISGKIVGMVLGLFNVNDPYLKRALVIGMANLNWSEDWTKFLSPVKNCKYLSDKVVDSILEYYLAKKVSNMFPGGGVFVDSMRNAITGALGNQETIQKIENIVEVPFCKLLQKVFGGGMIQNAVSSMTGQQPTQQTAIPQQSGLKPAIG